MEGNKAEAKKHIVMIHNIIMSNQISATMKCYK